MCVVSIVWSACVWSACAAAASWRLNHDPRRPVLPVDLSPMVLVQPLHICRDSVVLQKRSIYSHSNMEDEDIVEKSLGASDDEVTLSRNKYESTKAKYSFSGTT